jgi:hypothetical protein
VLGLAGGVGGVLLANWGVWVCSTCRSFHQRSGATVDGPVLSFALTISILTGWLLVCPRAADAQANLHGGLKEGGRGSGEKRVESSA